MFLVFAFLQINDPDPVLWIIIYGAMAAVCVMAAFRYYVRWLIIALLIGYVIYSTTFFNGVMEWFRQDDKSVLFDDIMKMRHPYIEESREFLGLVICIIILLIHLLLSRRQGRRITN
ncbi:MAG TPA: transmembrane 220 family protein [Chryseosolibacter sp.]|nr:transmembrane 220 family protein [Chryseosolibacter sp.]